MSEQFSLNDLSFPLLMKDVVESDFTGIIFVSSGPWRKGLIFAQGRLCAIQSNKTAELLGEIMVDLSIITPEENARALETARIERKKQGVILMEGGLIASNDINSALAHQLERRFLDIFSWDEGEVQKVPKPQIDKLPDVSRNDLARLIRRGIMDQSSFSCVISALSPFADAKPKLLRENLPTDSGVHVDDIDRYSVSEVLLLGQDLPRALLGLYCTGLVSFEESQHKALIEKLRMMLKAIKDQDPFETLGIDRHISEGGLKRAYIKLVKANHPDIYSYADDPEVKRLANDIFTEIQKAYNAVVKIREGREPEPKGLDESLQAELLYSQATEALKAKDYQKALDLFRLCMRMRPDELVFTESYIKTLFLKWQNTGFGNSLEIKAAIREGAKQFPKSDNLYVILGWVLKKEGSNKAAEAFRRALQINPQNQDAQRELRLLQMRGKL